MDEVLDAFVDVTDRAGRPRFAPTHRRGLMPLSLLGAAGVLTLVVGLAVVALGTRIAPSVAPAASPATAAPPTVTGRAWRLLQTVRQDGNQAYRVDAATAADQWEEMWDAISGAEPPPGVDLSREIAVSFAHGVGSSCPDLQLDEVVIDGESRTIYSVATNPLGDIPCTADLAGAVVFVVAIDRVALPPSPFTVQLNDPQRCSGLTCAAVEVDITSTPAPSTPSATPVRGDARFVGSGFSFDYPATWRLISDHNHVGPHGPAVMAAVGIGDFDLGCVTSSGGATTCSGGPKWTVPDDGIVLAYYFDAWLGPTAPWPTPSLQPDDQWVEIDGRPAVLSQTERTMTWSLAGAPEFVAIHWGPDLVEEGPELAQQVIASWQWTRASLLNPHRSHRLRSSLPTLQ